MFSSGNHEFEDRVHVDGDEGVIHFRPLIKEDEGDYRCHAFNDAGEDSDTGRLRVLSNLPHFCFCCLSNEICAIFILFLILCTSLFEENCNFQSLQVIVAIHTVQVFVDFCLC